MAAVIRGLSDEQLGRSARLRAERPPMTAEQVVERIVINHVATHHGSIMATAGGG